MENTTSFDFNTSEAAPDGTWNTTDGPRLPIFSMPDISSYFQAELVYLGVVFILGFPGNLLIIIVQVKNARKTTTDYLVLAMAMYELVCSGFNGPNIMFTNMKIVWKDIGTTFSCGLTIFLYFFTNIGSSQMLAAIAIDRCIKTCLPLCTLYNERVSRLVCVVVLAISFCMSFPWAIMVYWDSTKRRCLHYQTPPLANAMIMGRLSTTYGSVLFFIMFFSYLFISITLHRRHTKKVKGRLAILKTLEQSGHQKLSDMQSASADSGLDASVSETNSGVVTNEVTLEWSDTTSEKTDGGRQAVAGPQPVSVITLAKTGVSQGKLGDAQKETGVVVSSVANRAQADKKSLKKSKTSTMSVRKQQTRMGRPLLMEGRSLNRLTVIMFMISLVYMSTYIIIWLLYFIGAQTFGLGFFMLSFSIPLINCTTNAIIFVTMSSKFRQNARNIFCTR